MYGNFDTELLLLRLLEKYLVKKCNQKISKANSGIFFWKDEKGKLELVISVHVDDLFMAKDTETLKVIKENIKDKFNISESGKINTFLGFYYEWGHYVKATYAKMNMNKYVRKLVEG